MVILAVGRTLLRGGRLRVAKAEGARASLLLDPLPNARLAQRPDRRAKKQSAKSMVCGGAILHKRPLVR